MPERPGIVSVHVLDNPVWQALTTQHSALAITAAGSARYPSAIAPFAAVGDAAMHAGTQLSSLIGDGESVYLVGPAPDPPAGWVLVPRQPVSQMLCRAPPPVPAGPEVIVLTQAHRDDMLALTALVFPGFFRVRTLEMGSYLGICDGPRLVAMAGERIRLDGYQEISAVCTHPDYTGRGYAQRLVALLCNAAFERGFTPFLHVYHDSLHPIAIFRKLGFAERRSLSFWSLLKAARPVLRTERLALAELADRDAAFIHGLLNEPSFIRNIGDRGVRTLDDARRYIQEGPVASYARHGFGLYRVALQESDEPIGICGILKRDSLPEPDLGFSFLPAHWSRGFALESASAVMRHARETLGLGRVVAITSIDNEPSIRLLGKLGFRFEGMIRFGDDGSQVRLFASEP